jgi:hypothetical protein
MLVSNTMVIYHGILTLENLGTTVNYHGIFITLTKIPQYLTIEKRRYHGKLLQYFYNIGQSANPIKKFPAQV